MIKDIMNTVTIPVMAKVRIGHFVEAQVHFTCTQLHSYLMFARPDPDNPSDRCRLYRRIRGFDAR
jgi:hypothetical protein